MSQKNNKLWGWIFIFSFGLMLVIWLIFSFMSTSLLYGEFYIINKLINWIFIYFIPGLPLGIVFLVKGYKYQKYNRHIKLKTDFLNLRNIYQKDFDINNLTKTDIDKITKHGLDKKFSPGLAVFLNIITFGIFGFLYYGFRHDDLPIIKPNDFGSGKAIGYMFIPFFSIYWQFVFWLKLVNRLNLQYKLRNKNYKISKGLTITNLNLRAMQYFIIPFVNYMIVIPYVNYIGIFIFHSIMIYQIQSAINGLIKTK